SGLSAPLWGEINATCYAGGFLRLRFLHVDTVIHNFIDNCNHYLYHFRQIQDEANPRILQRVRLTRGDQPHLL
ncbi:hypothetical protein, partial [Klebsiella michiganensis]